MAEAHFDDFASRSGLLGPGATGRFINITAAVSSAALAIGAGVWAWQIAMRDISGVPVIRAIEGPMRIAPEDPGGRIASYTGLAVNTVIADLPGDGLTTTADGLKRAPGPVALATEDAPGLGLVAPLTDTLATAEPDPMLAPPIAPAAQAPAIAPEVSEAVQPLAPVGALAVMRSVPAPPRPAGLGRSAAPARSAQAPAPGGADPVAAALASAMAALAPLASAPVRELSSADLAPGSRLAQLGTFTDAAAARAAWDNLASRAGSLMAGKARVIEVARMAGQPVYRLRAQGFETEDAVRRFCAAIGSAAQDCVPVTHR